MTDLTVKLRWGPAAAHFPPGATFGPRTIDDFELVWIIAGSVTWLRHDVVEEATLRPGQLLLVRPTVHHEFLWDGERPTTHGYVHFTLPRPAHHDSWPLLRPISAPIDGLLSYLVWLAGEPSPHWRDRADDILGTLLRAFVDGPLPEQSARPEHPLLAAALDQVRREWRQCMGPISVTDLAAATHTSPANLSRLFRREYGCSPAAGLELVRLAQAGSLLMRSNLSVAQIAHATGFADPLYFSRRFHRAHGLSPRAYRATDTGTSTYPPFVHRLTRRLADSGALGHSDSGWNVIREGTQE